MIYFHGGGFVYRAAEQTDRFCRVLVSALTCVVVAVEYRLAPEHPFPAAPEDCFRATEWIAENGRSLGGNPERLILWGDSAGGNLATVVALMARDKGRPTIACQILVYPFLAGMGEFPSRVPFRDLPVFEVLMRTWQQYVPCSPDAPPAMAAPLLMEDVSALPPALVITAEHDPLRDEGEAYVSRLRAAGNSAKGFRIENVPHGFMTGFDDPQILFMRDQTVKLIRDRLIEEGLVAARPG